VDLSVLRHFMNVASHGSIRKAAGASHITQPALSKSIRRLERALEVELFERTVRGTQPTAFGPLSGRWRIVGRHADRLRIGGPRQEAHQTDGHPKARAKLLTLITRLILRLQPSIGLVSYRHGWVGGSNARQCADPSPR
jgi:hypothetical protein